MLFISYAQNYEDVMLWRALRHVENGFYIDVGANDPTHLSVTRSFYDAGWHGINIEPVADMHRQLQKERTRDINLPIALGAKEGMEEIFVVPDTGLTTIKLEFAENYREKGLDVQKKEILFQTLTKVWDTYVEAEVHFLKIDVEGAEKSVLEGLDLKKYRPWIIVVEALAPLTQDVFTYQSWESILVNEEYLFVYFDGLNRYYIAKEHEPLSKSFSAPPNIFDHFMKFDAYQTLQAYQEAQILVRKQSEHIQQLEIELNDKFAISKKLKSLIKKVLKL